MFLKHETRFFITGSILLQINLFRKNDTLSSISLVILLAFLDQEMSQDQSPMSPVRDPVVPKVEAPSFEDFLPDDSVMIKSEQPEDLVFAFLLCPICGNEAGKHVHYGGRACTSCRAFFRRSVQHDAYKKFFCSTKNCKIDSKSWRSCKWCRFEKCLASGLQPGEFSHTI